MPVIIAVPNPSSNSFPSILFEIILPPPPDAAPETTPVPMLINVFAPLVDAAAASPPPAAAKGAAITPVAAPIKKLVSNYLLSNFSESFLAY